MQTMLKIEYLIRYSFGCSLISKIGFYSLALSAPKCLKNFILNGYYFHKPNIYVNTEEKILCVFSNNQILTFMLKCLKT